MSTLARALAHPTRRRILQILSERVASPREMAVELGEPLGRVSHHVRWLVAREYLELVRTRPRRGAVEHFYRATLRPVLRDEEWSRIPARRRRELADALLRDIWSDVLDAGEAGAMAADDVHVSRTLLALDDEGRRALARALEGVVQLALQVQRESAERQSGQAARRSELAILHFDRIDGTSTRR
jgi:DNA-binding transcriptional ArsR family regulator